MSASNAFETALLSHIFNNTAIANVGDAGGLLPSATAGSLYVGLHTADPGEAGNQSTSEVAYGAYARAAVARTAGGWTVSGNAASNAAVVNWPEATSGTASAAYFSIGTAPNGTGTLLFSGQLATPLAISTGITPTAAIGAISTTAD